MAVDVKAPWWRKATNSSPNLFAAVYSKSILTAVPHVLICFAFCLDSLMPWFRMRLWWRRMTSWMLEDTNYYTISQYRFHYSVKKTMFLQSLHKSVIEGLTKVSPWCTQQMPGSPWVCTENETLQGMSVTWFIDEDWYAHPKVSV